MIQRLTQLQGVNQGITASVSLVLLIEAFAYELERGYPAAVAAYLDAG